MIFSNAHQHLYTHTHAHTLPAMRIQQPAPSPCPAPAADDVQLLPFSDGLLPLIGKIEKALAGKCNEEKMESETYGFTRINGELLPGTPWPTVNSQVLLDTVNAEGQRVHIVKATRKAGTRVGIHFHRYGGTTLILKGVMTDYVQGVPTATYGPTEQAGCAYYMPPCTPMSAAALTEDVELIDIFVGPPGEPFIEIMEPSWPAEREARLAPSSAKTISCPQN